MSAGAERKAEREAERKAAARVKRAEKRAQREAEARARNNAASRARRRADAELAKARALTAEELVDPLVHAAKVAAEHAANPEPAVEVPRINLVRHKVRKVTLERDDGTKREVVIDVAEVKKGLLRKRATTDLRDDLPTCACCKRKVAPVDRRPGSHRHVFCVACPSCACGARLSPNCMNPKAVARWGKGRPKCADCRKVNLASECRSCGVTIQVTGKRRARVADGVRLQCLACRRNGKQANASCRTCGGPVHRSTILIAEKSGALPRCKRCKVAAIDKMELCARLDRARLTMDRAAMAERGRRAGRLAAALSDDQAIAILKRIASGEGLLALSLELGLSKSTLKALRRGQNYQHLDAHRPWKGASA